MKPLTGQVLEGFGSAYTVLHRNRLYSCPLRGKLRRILNATHNPVAVGDRIRFTPISGDEGIVEELLPRRNKVSRPTKWGPSKEKVIVSNVDRLVVMVSVRGPVLKTGLIDRMLVVAEREELRSIVCINKIDLAAPGEIEPIADMYKRLRYTVLLVSAKTGEGLDELREELRDRFSVFLGQSGVGKTSVLNRLQPGLGRKVREVSEATDKGKHTTSYVSAVNLDFGGMVADTPGFRDFGLWGIEPIELGSLFREFRRYQGRCKFSPCVHIHEPECAVRDACVRGKIALSRYENYQRIYESFFEENQV